MIYTREIAGARGILFVCSGVTSLREIYLRKNDLMQRSTGMGSWYFAAIDLSDVTELQPDTSGSEMEMLTSQDVGMAKMMRPGLVVALIAKSGVTYGVSRMWQAINDRTGWHSEVFREYEAAESWIHRQVLKGFGVELPALELARETRAAGEEQR